MVAVYLNFIARGAEFFVVVLHVMRETLVIFRKIYVKNIWNLIIVLTYKTPSYQI